MAKVPSAVWIVDTKKEHLAVDEARKLGIPVIAILDTNCDPDEVDYPIPGNDDAIRSVTLLTRIIADAVAEGLIARSAARVGDAGQEGVVAADEPLAEWERELLGGDAGRRRDRGPEAGRDRRRGRRRRGSGRRGRRCRGADAAAEAPAAEAAAAEAPAAEAPAAEAAGRRGRGRGPAEACRTTSRPTDAGSEPAVPSAAARRALTKKSDTQHGELHRR